MSKTHFRKVFKSDHLGSADLEEMIEEGKSLIFTIAYVNQEYSTKVAGKKIDANIAYFKEPIKPMVLNATNSKIVQGLAGGTPWVEDWKNILIELYVDTTVQMKGERVGGVRIKQQAPRVLNQKEIEIIKAKITASVTLDELTKIYNSDIGIKTNKDLVTLLSNRRKELSV